MALNSRSLFAYGLEVKANNASIDFRSVALETPRQATLRFGFYSLTALATEISRAMKAVDPTRDFTVTVDRTIGGGLQNRMTIQTSGGFLQLLFGTGPRNASTVAPLIGFNSADYTGNTTYTGSASAGTLFSPAMVGYNYLSPDFSQKNFGAVNISASGQKESITFQIQEFWQVQFKYIESSEWLTSWKPLLRWLIQQRLFEFTPQVSDPTTFYEGTLEQSSQDGKGLAFTGAEMLPSFPNLYDAGLMRFRKTIVASTFI